MSMTKKIVFFVIASLAFGADPREYKKGTIDHWDSLSTGTNCSSTPGILTGISTQCGNTGVRVYHILTEDGFDYTVQADTFDPLKALQLGQEINYRIERICLNRVVESV